MWNQYFYAKIPALFLNNGQQLFTIDTQQQWLYESEFFQVKLINDFESLIVNLHTDSNIKYCQILI